MPQMCPICGKITFPLFDVPNIYMFTHLPKKKHLKVNFRAILLQMCIFYRTFVG